MPGHGRYLTFQFIERDETRVAARERGTTYINEARFTNFAQPSGYSKTGAMRWPEFELHCRKRGQPIKNRENTGQHANESYLILQCESVLKWAGGGADPSRTNLD
jgi:hypothetical protein